MNKTMQKFGIAAIVSLIVVVFLMECRQMIIPEKSVKQAKINPRSLADWGILPKPYHISN